MISYSRASVKGSIDAALAQLDARDAKGDYMDDGNMFQQFTLGLVDEITITRVPVLPG
jgi:dihydrofolate reductase